MFFLVHFLTPPQSLNDSTHKNEVVRTGALSLVHQAKNSPSSAGRVCREENMLSWMDGRMYPMSDVLSLASQPYINQVKQRGY